MDATIGNMLCPRDQTPLMAHKREGVEADVCPQCHGVWFSRPALEACVRQTSVSASLPTAPIHVRSSLILRRLPCPVCQPDCLVTHMHESLEVDTCPRCHGVWLDQGEMEHILQLHRTRAELERRGGPSKAVEASSASKAAVAGEAVVEGAGFLGEIGEAGTAVVEFFGGLF